MNGKAQIISTDMIFSMIAFIVIIAIFIGIFAYSNPTKGIDKYDYEMDYLFANMEKNVEQLNDSLIFIQGSRINSGKLTNFAQYYKDENIDQLVFGNVGQATGIGLDTDSYDVCLYLTDKNNTVLDLDGNSGSGIKYLGIINDVTSKSTEKCQDIINEGRNPCDKFSKVYSIFKPVLLDENNPDTNRIILMNLVVCKI